MGGGGVLGENCIHSFIEVTFASGQSSIVEVAITCNACFS